MSRGFDDPTLEVKGRKWSASNRHEIGFAGLLSAFTSDLGECRVWGAVGAVGAVGAAAPPVLQPPFVALLPASRSPVDVIVMSKAAGGPSTWANSC